MSDYSKTTNFTVKDGYTSGNPLKVIKGTEFDVEFDAIQVASESKADAAGAVLTGTTTLFNLTMTGDLTGTVDGGTY